MRHYCTYFDSAYLTRGLALFESLRRFEKNFVLWVLCMDAQSYSILKQLDFPQLRLVQLTELERFDPELAAVKPTRSQIEYYFTCSPCWPTYIFARDEVADLVTYLDADLYFFSEPQPIFDAMQDNSILIVGHRFPERLKHFEQFGVYNVGLLSIRRDETGIRCLARWRDQCINWCYDRLDDDKFADQKYLDDWPEQFSDLVVLEHPGCGLAPWNIGSYEIGRKQGQVVVVDDAVPLVFYHFHGTRQIGRFLYDPGLEVYGETLTFPLRRHLFTPYIRELRRIRARLMRQLSDGLSKDDRVLRITLKKKKIRRQQFLNGDAFWPLAPALLGVATEWFAKIGIRATRRLRLWQVIARLLGNSQRKVSTPDGK